MTKIDTRAQAWRFMNGLLRQNNLPPIPRNANLFEISKQYKKLMKIYHPDLNRVADAKEMSYTLNLAHEILRMPDKKQLRATLPKNWKKYYLILRQRVPMEDPKGNITTDTYEQLLATVPPDDKRSLIAAFDIFHRQQQERESLNQMLKQRVQGKLRGSIRRSFLTDKERLLTYSKMDLPYIIGWYSVENAMFKLELLYRRLRPGPDPHYQRLPVWMRPKPKKKGHVRWIVATLSLVLAIIGGKYVWDKFRKAYVKRPVKAIKFTPKLRGG